jgi:hypothetical protein
LERIPADTDRLCPPDPIPDTAGASTGRISDRADIDTRVVPHRTCSRTRNTQSRSLWPIRGYRNRCLVAGEVPLSLMVRLHKPPARYRHGSCAPASHLPAAGARYVGSLFTCPRGRHCSPTPPKPVLTAGLRRATVRIAIVPCNHCFHHSSLLLASCPRSFRRIGARESGVGRSASHPRHSRRTPMRPPLDRSS